MTSTSVTAALPPDMAFIRLDGAGGPEVLTPDRMPVPSPGSGELLVRVAAAGVNRPDLMQRRGDYPPPPGASDVPGLEIAGSVVATGPEVDPGRLGEVVCALVHSGGYAEFCVASAPLALPVPGRLSPLEAAALPETLFTVWSNLVDRGRLQAGQTLLVHGGSSGIGTMAIQLAKALGARVITTVGNEEKAAACTALGADRVVNYRVQDFVAAVLDETAGRGADVILDMVGGSYVGRNIAAVAPEGRIVQIAFLEGAVAEADFLPLMAKRAWLTGSTLRPRSVAEKAAIASALKQHAWPMIEAGRLRPIIDSVLPLAQAAEAHRRMETGAHIGKIMLSTDA